LCVSKAKQSKAKQSKAKQSKAKQSKAKQSSMPSFFPAGLFSPAGKSLGEKELSGL
jgi:hypothetical protein